MTSIVIAVAIMAVVAIFSVQNAKPVEISFFFWSFEASLAIVLFLSVLSGILIAALIALPGKIRRASEKRKEHKPDTQGRGIK